MGLEAAEGIALLAGPSGKTGKGNAGSFQFFDELMLEWGWVRRNL